jgi:hypothetical protein
MLNVYLPREGSHLGSLVDRGSALVADDLGQDRLVVYFEGNRYGAVNLQRWADRVECAAGRLTAKYPTSALCAAERDDIQLLGLFDGGAVQLDDPDDRSAIARWCGETDDEQLTITTVEHQRRGSRAALLHAAGGDELSARTLARHMGLEF